MTQSLPPPELSEFLAQSPLFGVLDRGALAALQAHVELVNVASGQTLVRKGDAGDAMYIVYRGQLGVYDEAVPGSGGGPEVLLRMLGRGEHFGEIALLRDVPRTATVRAARDSVVVRIARAGFEQLLQGHERARALLVHEVEQRLVRGSRPAAAELIAFLRTTPLFSELDAAVLAEIEPELSWMTLTAGEYLFRQGDPADSLYVVVQGRLRVFVAKDAGTAGGAGAVGQEEAVAELGRGQSVGELGLLTDEPRAATVRPLRDTELLRVSKAVVDRLLERHPRAMLGVVRAVIAQVRGPGAAGVGGGSRAVAIAPLGRNVKLGALVDDLSRALGTLGKVVHVTSSHARAVARGAVDDAPTGGDAVALIRWLNELEADHRYVLYECDPEPTAWTRRCLRQADRVLLVGDAQGDPRPTGVERMLEDLRRGSMKVRTDLVLLHPPQTREPSGTARWLTPRAVDSHHHVRIGVLSDAERMVRRLSGRSIGLVLSGGAAHGFAHIGAIRALREHGIAIDRSAGTSMGSVISAMLALGRNEAEMIAGVRKVFVEAKPLTDVTFPAGSFLEGKRFSGAIHDLFGETLIEDLWQSYFCVSGNLTRGEQEVHASGPLWNAVRTSCTIPGLVPPVVRGTELFVDGGVANNLPDDVMRADGQGPVIAVDVGPAVDLSIDARFKEYPPSWQVLAHNVNPFGKVAVPTLVHILARTAMLSSHGASVRAEKHCALYLRPRVEQFAFLDFKPVQRIVEAGYESTRADIAAWAKTRVV